MIKTQDKLKKNLCEIRMQTKICKRLGLTFVDEIFLQILSRKPVIICLMFNQHYVD